jgi:hypothetical protein
MVVYDSSSQTINTWSEDKTMELSRHKTRPINILDLPTDILHNVFDHFRDPQTTVQGKVKFTHKRKYRGRRDDSTDRRQTIQSARLVCQLFNQLASPLLCPILQVQLDQASLDLANDISRSPLIAAGVRGIQVVVDYRPEELATDLSRFKDQRKKDLSRLYNRCSYYAETWFLGGYDENDDTICPLPLREYNEAMDYYHSMCSAWDGCVRPADENANEDGTANDADSLEHQRVLRQCHEEYRQKHDEQHQLITDGSFVNMLAASVSQMTHCSSLRFVDSIDNYLDLSSENPTLLLSKSNTEDLSQFMATPQNWRTIEKLEGGAKLVPAKILSELVIAIHKAETTLRQIHISCFPLLTNYSMICPDRQDQLNPAWADLHAACQHLEEFVFGGGSLNNQPLQYNHLSAEDQTFTDKYLGAMLSGQSLEVVRLNFYAFGISERRNGLNRSKASYRIGSVLGTTNWLRVKWAAISSVSLAQGELEQFCNKLGDRLEAIFLRSVQLESGIWAGSLDILCEKVLSRCLDMKCRVDLRGLTGGEFGKGKETNPLDMFSFRASDLEEPLIVTLSQKYVSGVEVAENPLRG